MRLHLFLAAAVVGLSVDLRHATGGTVLEQSGRAAAIAAAANLASFQAYRCRYELVIASCDSVEDALAGKFRNRRSAEYRLLANDPYELLEYLGDVRPPVPPKHASPKGGKGPVTISTFGPDFLPYAHLTSDRHTLTHTPTMRVLGIASNDHPTELAEVTPMHMGICGHRYCHGPHTKLDNPGYEVSDLGFQVWEGRPVAGLRLQWIKDGSKKEYFFDPARGHLPARIIWWKKGRLRADIRVTARDCGSGRWFPEHTLQIDYPPEGQGVFEVRETRVLELNVDRPPGRDEFAISVPAGTQVNSGILPKNSFNLRQAERVHVDDAPKLLAIMQERSANPLADTAIPRRSYRWVGWAGLAAGLLAVSWGVRSYLRRRQLAGP
jgi:hypothetical protein